jgi:hypothetical protein
MCRLAVAATTDNQNHHPQGCSHQGPCLEQMAFSNWLTGSKFNEAGKGVCVVGREEYRRVTQNPNSWKRMEGLVTTASH